MNGLDRDYKKSLMIFRVRVHTHLVLGSTWWSVSEMDLDTFHFFVVQLNGKTDVTFMKTKRFPQNSVVRAGALIRNSERKQSCTGWCVLPVVGMCSPKGHSPGLVWCGKHAFPHPPRRRSTVTGCRSPVWKSILGLGLDSPVHKFVKVEQRYLASAGVWQLAAGGLWKRTSAPRGEIVFFLARKTTRRVVVEGIFH